GQGTCVSAQAEGIIFQNTSSTQIGRLACVANGTTQLTMFAQAFTAASTDVAENYSDITNNLEPGDLVSIDPNGPTKAIKKTATAADPLVLGVVSTAPGVLMSDIDDSTGATDLINPKPVSLSGRVPTKVSSENGPILIGDTLTSSSTPGVAMKATKSGPIVGKALEVYGGSGVGKIMVFVSTGWYVEPLAQDAGSGISDLSNLTSLSVENLTSNVVSTQVLLIGNTKLSMAKNGGLKIEGDVEITGELTAKKLNVGEEAAGSSILETGETKVFIETTVLTDKSQVLVTPTTLTEKNLTVTKKEAEKGFTVEIISPESKDITFDWFIVN
ncbi:MAG TPA: hypothetical protein VF303_00225, partial [Candidatus Nanoarchaeia archaeon]